MKLLQLEGRGGISAAGEKNEKMQGPKQRIDYVYIVYYQSTVFP